jgi:hypothetical protein
MESARRYEESRSDRELLSPLEPTTAATAIPALDLLAGGAALPSFRFPVYYPYS